MIDNARRAARELAALLRRRGTSPAVGKSIRRAAQHLDAAVTGGADAAVAAAVATLQECLQIIQESPNAADRLQLDGVAAALVHLFPIVREGQAVTPATPSAMAASNEAPPSQPSVLTVPPLAPAVPAAPTPPASIAPTPQSKSPTHSTPKRPGPQNRKARWGVRASTNAVLLPELISRLKSLHVRRVACLNDGATTFGDLANVDATLLRQVTALRWSLETESSTAGFPVREALIADDPIGALVGLFHLGEPSAFSRAFDILTPLPEEELDSDLLGDVLSWAIGEGTADVAKSTFLAPKTKPALRPFLVRPLVRLARLSADDLILLLDDDHDGVVTAAASAVVLGGRTMHQQASAILGRASVAARKGQDQRADALLLAAVAVGSNDALPEVRRRIGTTEASAFLIDALAVAGDAADSHRLLNLARGSGRHARRAILAAAHLGVFGSVAALERMRPELGDEVVDQARRAIVGGGRGPASYPNDVRLSLGTPWTIMGALERLESTQEPCWSRTWTALELAVRTGIEMNPSLVAMSATTQNNRELQQLRDALQPVKGRFQPGRWYYQGTRQSSPFPGIQRGMGDSPASA